jgi:hypothetical protein
MAPDGPKCKVKLGRKCSQRRPPSHHLGGTYANLKEAWDVLAPRIDGRCPHQSPSRSPLAFEITILSTRSSLTSVAGLEKLYAETGIAR